MIVIVDCSIVLMIFGRTRARTHTLQFLMLKNITSRMRRNKYTLSSEQRWQQIIFRLLFLFRTFSRRYNLLLPALLIIVHCSYSFLWCIWLTVLLLLSTKKSRLVNEMSVMIGLDERASDSKQMIKQRNLNEFQNWNGNPLEWYLFG